MHVSRACNDLFDRLTLIGCENDSVASERALQLSRAHRRKYRRAHREHQSGARQLAHENNTAHKAGAFQSHGLDRPRADRGYDRAHPDAKQNERSIN